MKYLITEDRMEGAIERFLKKSFPEVIGVSFKTISVMLGSSNEIIQRKVIEVTTDPHNILTGGKAVNYNSVMSIKQSIWNGLNSMFGLDLYEYGSKWEVKIYSLNRVEI